MSDWGKAAAARSAAYAAKLKDPRWQARRAEVLVRDDFMCQGCQETGLVLEVHHTYYTPGKQPWEYDLDALITLCRDCHAMETNQHHCLTREAEKRRKFEREFSSYDPRIKADLERFTSRIQGVEEE
jgi:5-methylcytosine-specific restriction endonuclease McrA